MAESEGGENQAAKVKAEPGGDDQENPAVHVSAKIRLPEGVEDILEYERTTNVSSDLRTREEVLTLPTRLYLDYTVVAILLDAMSAVDRERPPNPIEYMAAFLFKNKEKYAPQYKQD